MAAALGRRRHFFLAGMLLRYVVGAFLAPVVVAKALVFDPVVVF